MTKKAKTHILHKHVPTTWGVLILVALAVGIVLTVWVVKQQQDNRSEASGCYLYNGYWHCSTSSKLPAGQKMPPSSKLPR